MEVIVRRSLEKMPYDKWVKGQNVHATGDEILLSNGEWLTEYENTNGELYEYTDAENVCCVDENEKFFIVWHQIGNFAFAVFASTIFNEVQDYLDTEFQVQCEEGNYNRDDSSDEELFYSYYSIQEVDGND